MPMDETGWSALHDHGKDCSQAPASRVRGNASNARCADFVHLVRDRHSGIEAVTAQFHGHAYDMHSHDEWLVGVTHAGVQDFFCRGQRRQSTAGRVILIEPGERHDGQAVHEKGFRYSMLYLPQSWLREEMGGWDADIGFRQTLADDRQLGEAIAAACRAIISAAPRLAADAARDRVVEQLRQHLGRGARPAPAVISPVAERAMDYIQAHYDEPFSLEDLAHAAGATDRFQLSRTFRRRFGTSPHACLVEVRLTKARAMLRSAVPPAEAAFASGFADQSHLGRWFRRAYGLTPAAYRLGCTNVPDGEVTVE
ncbi:AraC family transcriptional regulator [Microvirga lotononidis]|uniref:Transcriptional regulator containing an amidase domain and an AraC-type DNA-binding HTH domain n=1 Tax=Microvirga lotononidis TaxID=864069 RepID=I4YSV4_9HYPH|nr:AraC family transcriptional regulator [Microvirga lotononidis]EIM27046.1 transcriptional regulator containing an amidase domain and an AraC-type DNA-binding HTH domain [Microvirga lotononidis]WQO28764.1 AraC family transcriptional regulator [Microvirga lotononidis]